MVAFRPTRTPSGLLVAFSGRGAAPETEPSPTSFLARRFADALGKPELPLVRATQVHGVSAVRIRQSPSPGAVTDAGSCDVLATDCPGVGLVVQTADCVPIVLAGERAVGVAHAGWRGSSANAAAAAVGALRDLGEEPARLSAWLGPAIGACCYEVGGEVAARFAGDFLRSGCDGRQRLDLKGLNASQLVAAGVPAERIRTHPSCTRCGGKEFASYRRDGAAAGRMIGLVARLDMGSSSPASGEIT
jgi:YfiH family protein